MPFNGVLYRNLCVAVILGLRCYFSKDNPDVIWDLIDFVTGCPGLFVLVLDYIVGTPDVDPGFATVFRIARLLRIPRIFRSMCFIRELCTLAFGMAFFSVVVLMMLVLYTVAIMLMPAKKGFPEGSYYREEYAYLV